MPDSDAPTDAASDLPASYRRKAERVARDAGEVQLATGRTRDADALATALRAGREKWSNLPLHGLLVGYKRVIWPLLEAHGEDPATTIPTREWLQAQGHGNLEYALREYHDLTVSRFCTEIVGVDPADEWAWPTDHADTRERLADWLYTQRERRDDITSDRTVRTKRDRLATYVDVYRTVHGTGDLLAPIQDHDQRAEAYDRVTQVYDRLDQRLSTARSKYQYHSVIDEFYQSCVSSGRAAFNPVADLMDRFGWDTTDDAPNPVALSAPQVRRLYREASSLADQLLVIALGAWGLRRTEVAALHVNQLVLDPDEERAQGPYLAFETRKNGPGTVALVYGAAVVRERLAAVSDDWTDHTTGYLFPSEASRTGHISPSTVANRFQRLAEQAGVRVDGDLPTPKYCRRFWYDRYSTVMAQVDEWLQAAAEEQGSASVEVLKQNYVPADRLRELRRERLTAELADAFEGVP